MRQEECFQFGWGHLEAFVLDQFLQPINDEQLIILIDVPNVARMQPPLFVYGSLRSLRIIKVPCVSFLHVCELDNDF